MVAFLLGDDAGGLRGVGGGAILMYLGGRPNDSPSMQSRRGAGSEWRNPRLNNWTCSWESEKSIILGP